MHQTVTLRAWQRDAIAAFERRADSSFLAVACPGAGKTTFALTAIRQWLAGERRPIVIVVPTQHLKAQWASAALRFGIHLDPNWSSSDGPPAPDVHGIVVTYAQTGTSQAPLARYCRDGIVVLDEVHHAAAERTWGDACSVAFNEAAVRLLLSGTPFRSDDSPIPFVRYSEGSYGDAIADFEYGYGEALVDGGVVRPVYFPRFDGRMEWMNAEGELHEATFGDEIRSSEWGARLRTALSPTGEWLTTVLDSADRRLSEIREVHSNAGGLIIATDHEHARAIADLLARRRNTRPQLALSDDPQASTIIENFARSDDPWIIAVRMISEGVDIPRLRVAVYATTTTTPMFFRQAVGRIARWTPGVREQKAFMYLPDDIRLRHHAVTIAHSRRHSIEARRERLAGIEFDPVESPQASGEQMSLFAALHSTVLDEQVPEEGIDTSEEYVALVDDLEGYPINLPPPPPLPGQQPTAVDDTIVPGQFNEPPATRSQEKQSLRDLNALRVQELVARTGFGYPQVNTRLNREAGIERITTATVTQLKRRVAAADAWVAELSTQRR